MLDTKPGRAGTETPFAEVIEGVRRVAAKAAARAGEIDAERRFPADLFDEIEATGACRIMTPKAYGGLEMGLREATEAVFECARGNGSLGWLMMVGTSQSIGNGLFCEETVRKLTGDYPDVRLRAPPPWPRPAAPLRSLPRMAFPSRRGLVWYRACFYTVS
jgi:Acyl-CoA dehydrogenase, N-terminal domain